MSSGKACCTRFEPQTWRKTLCKNCFKTADEHRSLLSTSSQAGPDKTPSKVKGVKKKATDTKDKSTANGDVPSKDTKGTHDIKKELSTKTDPSKKTVLKKAAKFGLKEDKKSDKLQDKNISSDKQKKKQIEDKKSEKTKEKSISVEKKEEKKLKTVKNAEKIIASNIQESENKPELKSKDATTVEDKIKPSKNDTTKSSDTNKKASVKTKPSKSKKIIKDVESKAKDSSISSDQEKKVADSKKAQTVAVEQDEKSRIEVPSKSVKTAAVGNHNVKAEKIAADERIGSSVAGQKLLEKQDKNTSPVKIPAEAASENDTPEKPVESKISQQITSTKEVLHSKENSQVTEETVQAKATGEKAEKKGNVEFTNKQIDQEKDIDLSPTSSKSQQEVSGQCGSTTSAVKVDATLSSDKDDNTAIDSSNPQQESQVVPGEDDDNSWESGYNLANLIPREWLADSERHSPQISSETPVPDASDFDTNQGRSDVRGVQSLFHHRPDEDNWDNSAQGFSNSNGNSVDVPTGGIYFVRQNSSGSEPRERTRVRRRRRNTEDDMDIGGREDAMMEGTRMLIDSLREKVGCLEDKCEKLEREKAAVGDLLSVRKREFIETKEDYKERIIELEDQVRRLSSEKNRLTDRLKLPESERTSLKDIEKEIAQLTKRLEDTENVYRDSEEENVMLRQEIRDLQLEMEEMHDQFREDEALEFRELQKELEATAKNCRILQFKLRKAERRNEQIEADRLHCEEKIRQLENRFDSADDRQHIRELEEELKMAKEVSVRLHDELELVEEKRARYEEELDRVNDILTESENRRIALQQEVDKLTSEMDRLRIQMNEKLYSKGQLELPKKTPKLEQKGREGSSEHDVAQLMRDLSDSLERENDLKEQLKYAEEETRIMRKKLYEMDEENESLNMQLQKMSAARRHFRKEGQEKEIVTEREHELRLQMELAEEELKVLRRKMNDIEMENEDLTKHVRVLQGRLEGKPETKEGKEKYGDRPVEEQIESMAHDIDKLKWELINKDQEASRKTLKKSRSLDECQPEYHPDLSTRSPLNEYQTDLKKQLDLIQQEASVLRDQLNTLEKDNEKLLSENKKLQKTVESRIPSIQADDSAMQNIDLKTKLKELEAENMALNKKLKSLDVKATKQSKKVTKATSGKEEADQETTETRDLKAQVRNLRDESEALSSRVNELESVNAKLKRDLSKSKQKPAAVKKKNSKTALPTMSDLPDRVLELEREIERMKTLVMNREEENEKLEDEINGYREDMDKMLDSFCEREKELLHTIESLQQKNEVISSLLDVVTERAEMAQKELEKYHGKVSTASVISVVSDVSVGSDDVFVPTSPEPTETEQETILEIDWEEQLKKRIEGLELLLQEERDKVENLQKKVEMKDTSQSAIRSDAKLQEKEKKIIKQELTLCQKQLKEANENIQDLKKRLEDAQTAYDALKHNLDKVTKELGEERKKLKEEEKKESKPLKATAGWRWEKQELERTIKEQNKKIEDLHAELKKQQFKWKMAGEDAEKENKRKQKLEEQIKNLKEQIEALKKEDDSWKRKYDDLQDTVQNKEKKWEEERRNLEKKKAAVDKELKQKEESLAQKDDIIKSKDKLVKEKDKAIKNRDEALKAKDNHIKKTDTELETKSKECRDKETELSSLKSKVHDFEAGNKDKDSKIKSLNNDLGKRDDRLKEKDEILEKLNQKVVDKDKELKELDKSSRQATKKLQEKESELKKIQTESKQNANETKSLNKVISDLKTKSDDLENTHRAEVQNVIKEKDKLQSELDTSRKERKALLNDLQEVKEKLRNQEEQYRKEKSKRDLDLKQATEKIRTFDSTRTMKDSDKVKTLKGDKEELIGEKYRLSDQINCLKRDMGEQQRQWNVEREDLQRIIAEKTRMMEDNNAICEKMEREMEKLKTQVSGSTSPRLTPIPVFHESKKGTPDRDMVECQELFFKAEKEKMKELHDGDVRCLKEELTNAQEQLSALRSDNDSQMELLQSSRKALADLRSRYDDGITSWTEERGQLQKKMKQLEKASSKTEDLEKDIESLKEKLAEEERKRRESENKYATEKTCWHVEQAKQAPKTPKSAEVTSPVTPLSSASRVSSFRAKFDKFEQPKPKKLTLAIPDSKKLDTKAGPEPKDALDEAQTLAKNLQKQVEEVEKAREKDRKELKEKLEKNKKDWKKEREDLVANNTKLERKTKSLAELEKSIAEMQCKLQEEREKFQQEKSHLRREIEDTKKSHTDDKTKMSRALAELKQLTELAPSFEERPEKPPTPIPVVITTAEESSKKTSPKPIKKDRQKVTRVIPVKAEIDSGDTPVKTKVIQALQRLSELLAGVSHSTNDPTRPPRSTAPPGFRRSLSFSEGELFSSADTLVYSSRAAPELLTTPVQNVAMALTSPTIVRPSASDRPGRTHFRRSISSQEPSKPSSSTAAEGHSFRGDVHSRPSSFYASGTQSAYTSRETSPDKRSQIRKITPYPVAPPSMIIPPSHTPRREQSLERSSNALEPEQMQNLYDKLSAIEVKSIEAAPKDRKARVLRKSMSVDSSLLLDPPDISGQQEESASPQSSYEYSIYRSIPHSTHEVSDSSTSRTARRPGDSEVPPQSESFSRTYRAKQKTGGAQKRSESLSPKSARRKFFDDYPYEPIGAKYVSWHKKKQEETQKPLTSKDADSASKATLASAEDITSAGLTKSDSKQTPSKISSIIQSVKDKRKLFGLKKSSSVDSAVHSSFVRAGVQASKPAAPSTYEPPEVPVVDPPKRRPYHTRAASIDLTTLFSTRTTPSSSSGGKATSKSGNTEESGRSGSRLSVRSAATPSTSAESLQRSRDASAPDLLSSSPVIIRRHHIERLRTPSSDDSLNYPWRISMALAAEQPVKMDDANNVRAGQKSGSAPVAQEIKIRRIPSSHFNETSV